MIATAGRPCARSGRLNEPLLQADARAAISTAARALTDAGRDFVGLRDGQNSNCLM